MRTFIILIALIFTLSVTNNIYPQDWWNKVKEKTKEYIDKGKEKVKEYYDNNKEKVKQYYNDTKEKSKESVEKWKQQNPDTYKNIISKTNEVSSEIKRNPTKIFEYKKQADKYVQKAVITGVKNVPVYDSRTGQITTFDSYCRQFVSDVGGDAIYGSDIEQDPVGTAVMIMMDNDYLLEAKLIKSSNGEWMSLNEAIINSSEKYLIQTLQNDYLNMRSAYYSGDAYTFNNSFQSFNNNLKTLNSENVNSANYKLVRTTGSGLVAFYPLDGNTENKTGNGLFFNQGYASSTSDRYNRNNKAYYFNGYSDFFEIDNSINLTSDFTISVWIKPDRGQSWSIPVCVGNDWMNIRIGYDPRSRRVGFNGWLGGFTGIENSYTQLINDVWYHIVGVRSGNNWKLYINGELDSNTIASSDTYNNLNLALSKNAYSGYHQDYFKGSIDNLKIFQRNLTDKEIEQLYNEN